MKRLRKTRYREASTFAAIASVVGVDAVGRSDPDLEIVHHDVNGPVRSGTPRRPPRSPAGLHPGGTADPDGRVRRARRDHRCKRRPHEWPACTRIAVPGGVVHRRSIEANGEPREPSPDWSLPVVATCSSRAGVRPVSIVMISPQAPGAPPAPPAPCAPPVLPVRPCSSRRPHPEPHRPRRTRRRPDEPPPLPPVCPPRPGGTTRSGDGASATLAPAAPCVHAALAARRPRLRRTRRSRARSGPPAPQSADSSP